MIRKYLKSLFEKLYGKYERQWIGNDMKHWLFPSFEMIMNEMLSKKEKLIFVEIGANDGVNSDKLHPYIASGAIKGILVEPQPDVFERLKANYKETSGLHFENVAIASKPATLPFYTLKENYASYAKTPLSHSEFTDRISSLSVENILKHVRYEGDWRDILEEKKVDCVTFNDLLHRSTFNQFDIIQIDAEGMDAEILMSIDLKTHSPAFICFEHLHLNVDDYVSSLEFLTNHGYKWCKDGNDILAFK